MGVLIIRALLVGVHVKAPDFWEAHSIETVRPCRGGEIWEVEKARGPNIDSKEQGSYSKGQPPKGLPIYRKSQAKAAESLRSPRGSSSSQGRTRIPAKDLRSSGLPQIGYGPVD